MSKRDFRLIIIKTTWSTKVIKNFAERLFQAPTASYSTLVEIDIRYVDLRSYVAALYDA